MMKRFILSILALSLTACASTSPRQTGILEGHVTIGPLVSVVREGEPTPTPGPDVYGGRKIVISSEDGQREIIQAGIDSRGNYQVILEVGTYMVDINHLGIDHGVDLPRIVGIVAGQVTRLDVEIDTGIR